MEQQLAHYMIKETLGEGSFAWVYRAYDQKFEQDVALKVLKPIWMSDPQAIGRFKQEAITARKLRHPHIIDIYDVGEAEGQVYLALLLVKGETLSEKLTREGPLKWDEVLRITSAIGDALDYAHGQGIIHRDIKPENILLGADNHAYLGDFGLVLAVEGSTRLSASGGMVGTGHYMAPEVWDGKKATPATDVYALSCVIYEMLMSEVLFEGSSMMAVMKKHSEGPKFPDAWPVDVPDGVTDVLKRGLSGNSAERISSAGELAVRLAALATSDVSIPTPPTPDLSSAEPVIPTPTTKGAAKSGPPWLLIGSAVVIIFVIAVIAFFALSGNGDNTIIRSPTESNPEASTAAEVVEEVATEEPEPTATPTTEKAGAEESAEIDEQQAEQQTEIEALLNSDELITTESGLQYVMVEEGNGETPKAGSIVQVHYNGMLEDGTKFDSSYDRGEPIQFALGTGQVIPGWDEGIGLLTVGSKAKLVIPPELAYGEQGAGGVIPPNATLIFDVELVDILPGPPSAPTEVDEADYTTTGSGLQYFDFEEGSGETPEEGQTVVVHYTGWLEDGTMFDSSLVRGQPFDFTLGVGQVIPGWDEGVASMKVGSKRQLVIPAELAYGERGAGGVIPPNATLIFEVELVDIQ